MINVVGGIIRKDGKILIAQRGQHKSLPGKWEFPGGKIEDGESPEQALERELLEEFGIAVMIQEHFHTNIHFYPTFDIRLICYNCIFVQGEFSLTDHDQVQWCDPRDLLKYDFAEADMAAVRLLMGE
jgi:8-oxo-dGTP diphosphatase